MWNNVGVDDLVRYSMRKMGEIDLFSYLLAQNYSCFLYILIFLKGCLCETFFE